MAIALGFTLNQNPERKWAPGGARSNSLWNVKRGLGYTCQVPQDPLQQGQIAPSQSASKTFAPGALRAILSAQNLARAQGSATVESVHLLMGALQDQAPDAQVRDAQVRALLQISGLKWDEVWLYAQSTLEPGQPIAPDQQPKLGESARRTLQFAGKEARRNNRELVDDVHLVVACFRPQNAPGIAEVLAPLGISADQLSLHLRQLSRGAATAQVRDESPLAQLTAAGQRALEAAHAAMRASFCGRISTLHLLIGILENPDGESVQALQTLMIDVDELRNRARAALFSDGAVAGPTRQFTPAAKRALDRAKAAARAGGRSHIGSADLMMGLLPQPALWIERAQFGARPDDPAAPVIREIDADLFRSIFNGAVPAQAPRPAPAPVAARPTSPPIKSAKVFLRCFAFQFLICTALGSEGAWRRPPVRSATSTAMMLLMIGIVIGSGLVACALLIFSKDAARKSVWTSGFMGALLGVLIGMAISNAFR